MDWLNQDEMKQVILAIVTYSGEATREEIQRVVDWCEEVRCASALLDIVVSGKLSVWIDEEGDAHFKQRAGMELSDDELWALSFANDFVNGGYAGSNKMKQ